MRENRAGFTIAEVLVALAIMAVLGGLMVPVILGAVDRSRIDAGRQSLEGIGEGIQLFTESVNKTPGTLSQLVVPITGTHSDICGAAYNGGEQNRWGGPYLDRAMTGAGVPIGIGTVSNAFGVVADPSGIDYLRVDVQQVVPEDAVSLDAWLDGGDGETGGAIRWTAPAGGFVTVRYLVPFRDC